jgi:hypothetical protein
MRTAMSLGMAALAWSCMPLESDPDVSGEHQATAPAKAFEKPAAAAWRWPHLKLPVAVGTRPPVQPHPECDSDDACDDGSGCTVDACVDEFCVNEPVRQVLLSGTVDPSEEGWTSYGEDAGHSDGYVVTVDTLDLTTPKPIAMYALSVPASEFETQDLTWRLRVISASHNPFDAAASFFPAYSGWYGSNVERPQMIYFDDDGVGWGDDAASAGFDATVEHDYRLHVESNGDAELWVDDELALTRQGMVLNGTIGFGDHTNDTGFDSAFRIREIALEANAACVQ